MKKEKITTIFLTAFKKTLATLVLFALVSTSLNAQETKRTKVTLETEYGTIVLELYNETPLHRDNFIKLVKEGYYDNLLFHRVIKDFMIQGGDPESKNAAPGVMLGNGGPNYTIPAEILPDLFHKRGALAGARRSDTPNSSGSQFYIVQGQKLTKEQLETFAKQRGKPFSDEQIAAYTSMGGTPHLDGAYTVFGEVVEGLDVVEKITAVAVDGRSRPLEDIKMTIKISN